MYLTLFMTDFVQYARRATPKWMVSAVKRTAVLWSIVEWELVWTPLLLELGFPAAAPRDIWRLEACA